MGKAITYAASLLLIAWGGLSLYRQEFRFGDKLNPEKYLISGDLAVVIGMFLILIGVFIATAQRFGIKGALFLENKKGGWQGTDWIVPIFLYVAFLVPVLFIVVVALQANR